LSSRIGKIAFAFNIFISCKFIPHPQCI
jgi:hypothetical protein